MQGLFVQNVLVMRHGDRIDDSEPLWALQAARPWDPPLAKDGEIRAWATGRRLRPRNLGFRLHRVLVSPFLRCLQTAAAVVSALCAKCEEEASLMAQETGAGVPIDRSAVKVSIEYGLSEVMSSRAINVDRVPQDGKWFPDISELESFLPAGTVDHSSERMCHQGKELVRALPRLWWDMKPGKSTFAPSLTCRGRYTLQIQQGCVRSHSRCWMRRWVKMASRFTLFRKKCHLLKNRSNS
ncbi:uncharacterized protein LOC144710251 isoform X2 [Wolffia australiana]